ncbi:hypothetical protein [Sulfitobacter sp. R18_1]|uniref:hypothetical protein n=1 Tax=Sulfitobacter sp. R18_1 TaxID=2821104 RepID=UPI001ADC6226|nr:hypothetical protein [Sulfitobacter sp. R18_1]MBO9428374.1 hypothetical protein [Sulfitobacter sp. R18_1]
MTFTEFLFVAFSIFMGFLVAGMLGLEAMGAAICVFTAPMWMYLVVVFVAKIISKIRSFFRKDDRT